MQRNHGITRRWRLPAILFMLAMVCIMRAGYTQDRPSAERDPSPTEVQNRLIERLRQKLEESRPANRGKNSDLLANSESQRPRLGADVPDDLRNMVGDIWKEVERLRAAGSSPDAARLAAELHRHVQEIHDGLRPLPDDQAELHVAGLYEGRPPEGKRKGGQHPLGLAEVHVEFPGQPIVLALCAYEPVKWQVRLAEGVQLKKVLLSGYYDQEVAGLPDGVPVSTENERGQRYRFYDYSKDRLPRQVALARALKEATGLNVATFQGTYGYAGTPFVIGEQNAEWRRDLLAQRLAPLHESAISFQRREQRERMQSIHFSALYVKPTNNPLPHQTGEAALATFTPSGPIATSLQTIPGRVNHVAIDPKGPTYYGMRLNQVVMFEPGKDTFQPLDIDASLPRPSWPCGLAFDTKRRRLAMVTKGGVGHMYIYDVDEEKWSVTTALNNIELNCLGYSEENDKFYGLSQPHDTGICQLRTFSSAGVFLGSVELERQIFTEQHARGPIQVIGVGRLALILTPPQPDPEAADLAVRSRSYLVDPENGKILFSDAVRPHPGLREFRKEELVQIWKGLLTDDASQADLLIWQLASGGEDMVAFLREQIRPLPTPQIDADKVARLIAQLNDAIYETRAAASRELARLGDLAAEQLAKALENPASAEQRFRLRRLLASIEAVTVTPEDRREVRALRALSRSGIPTAIEYLRELSQERLGAARSKIASEMLQLADRS